MHDWKSLKTFLCLSLTVGSVGVMVMTPDWESEGCEFKYSTRIFSFLKKKPSLILNTKSEKHKCQRDIDFNPSVLKCVTHNLNGWKERNVQSDTWLIVCNMVTEDYIKHEKSTRNSYKQVRTQCITKKHNVERRLFYCLSVTQVLLETQSIKF